MTTQVGFTPGRLALSISGGPIDPIEGAEGGGATADVVTGKPGPDLVARKHLGGLHWEAITITCAAGMSKSFNDWLKAAVEDKGPGLRKDGSIHSCDYDGNIKKTMDWFHGQISEINLPALDAAANAVVALTVKIMPEATREKKGVGTILPAPPHARWLASAFRLSIAGCDEACRRAMRIESISFRLKPPDVLDNVGPYRPLPSGAMDISNIVVTFPEADADSFKEWHHSFVILGKNTEDQERQGFLEYLATDLKQVLFRLDFHGLGIFKLAPKKVEGDSGASPRLRAEMYCQAAQFTYDTAALATKA